MAREKSGNDVVMIEVPYWAYRLLRSAPTDGLAKSTLKNAAAILSFVESSREDQVQLIAKAHAESVEASRTAVIA